MESNALPGFTNRILARFVDRAAVSFEQSLRYFRGKGVVTGNPVRREFFELSPKLREKGRFSLLIFGGSQGARAINEAMVAGLPELKDVRDVLHITHQTGTADLETVRGGYIAAGWDNVDVRPYLENIVTEFAAADLIICRAGATTTAELIAGGKASIMIPFPFAADDHQRKNGEAMELAGAARMIVQKSLTGTRLAEEIRVLVNQPEKVTAMEVAARKLSRGDAAAAVVDLIEAMG
jgi:UDP-N-acetylglucosamine--N-acetylmuramyl-(pentapeptide) pyrophosphoryl-undecaprenol N-acetylglucosamine transferase